MREDYVHFLHRLVLMGTADPRRCGKYRCTQVHVGNPDLFFPPPSAIPQLVREFCKHFPTILPTTVKYDPIRKAAEASHRFVRIHPYHDGNGRVSRLLMNLVLWGHHPPVYLKADAKGRHRYGQALHRGDRGNAEPLACLIAMSLIEVYEKMLDAVGASPTTGWSEA
jgi:Fic family protein